MQACHLPAQPNNLLAEVDLQLLCRSSLVATVNSLLLQASSGSLTKRLAKPLKRSQGDVNAVSLTQQTLQWWTAALARVEAVSHLVGVLGQKAAGLTAVVTAGLVGIRLQAPLNRVACHTQDPGDMADGFVFFKNKLPHKKTAFFGNHGFGTSVVMNNGTHDPRLSRHCKSTSRRPLEVGQN